MLKIAVLISGGGSNLQSIIDAIESKKIAKVELVYVIADRECSGLERAKKHGIPHALVKKEEVLAFLEDKEVDLIVLAGYLSILPANFIARWTGKIINIHPSLLPKFGGKGMHGIHVHRAVLEAKESKSGCSVHYVTEEIDRGEILGQEEVPVLEGDSPESLQKRVLEKEHLLLPRVIAELAQKN